MTALLIVVGAVVLVWALLRTENSSSLADGAGGRTRSTMLAAVLVPAGLAASDDEHILVQDELPPVARVDYAAFPSLDPPVDPKGRVWYVATTGDDAAPGTVDRTLRTIQSALARASDGDTVLVRQGTYAAPGLDLSRSRFLLSAYPGEDVIVVPKADGDGTGLTIAAPGQHDVTVRGLTLQGFRDVGVLLGNPVTVRRVVLDGLTVSGSAEGVDGDVRRGTVAIDGLAVRHVTLREIRRIGFQFGEAAGRNVRITGLHVQMAESASTDSGSDGLAFEAGDNVLIENSIIEGAAADGIDLKASRAAVVNTVVRHVGRNGVKLWAGGDVINSVVYDTGADAQLVTEGGSYRILGSTFAYHLMRGGRSYAATFGQPQASGDVLIAGSVFFQQPGPLYVSSKMKLRVERSDFWGFPDRVVDHGQQSWDASNLYSMPGTGNLAADPRFVAPESDDFHPGEDSPLFGAGGVGAGAPGFDLVLEARDPGDYTIGAYQTGATPRLSFADVPFDDPYREAIVSLAQAKVVGGYAGPNGVMLFKPADPVRRAQFAKMICGVLEIPVTEDLEASFTDLGHDDSKLLYPHDYVAAAAAAGITKGLDPDVYGPNVFGPYENITRAQVVTMIVRGAEKLAPKALSAPPAGFAGALGDFSPQHAPAMRRAEYNGLLAGVTKYGPEWDPWRPATRGEVAQMLYALAARL